MEEERENKKGMNLLELPEGCLSHILSLTSPVYVLRSSLVCKLFRSLAKSDLVWDKFLPSDYHIIQRSLSSSDTHFGFPSRKQLVLHLCRSFILLEGGNKSFALDKWTAKKCYVLGARELMIASGDNPHCWRWDSLSESRPWSLGFDVCPVKVSVSSIDRTGAYIEGSCYNVSKTFYLKAPESNILDIVEDDFEGSIHPKDGQRWLKIDMGKHFNREGGEDVAVLEMTLTGLDTVSHKSGLIVHGIELLPL